MKSFALASIVCLVCFLACEPAEAQCRGALRGLGRPVRSVVRVVGRGVVRPVGRAVVRPFARVRAARFERAGGC